MELTVGAIVEGTVKSITNFGAFIALPGNVTGMVHISEVASAYVSDIRQHLTEGQDVKVMVIGCENGKINLSIKRLEAKPQQENRQHCKQDHHMAFRLFLGRVLAGGHGLQTCHRQGRAAPAHCRNKQQDQTIGISGHRHKEGKLGKHQHDDGKECHTWSIQLGRDAKASY